MAHIIHVNSQWSQIVQHALWHLFFPSFDDFKYFSGTQSLLLTLKMYWHVYLVWHWYFIYTEHQWNVTTDSRTLNTGTHLDLSGQRIAICSAFIFVVYSPMNRYYRKWCSSHMNTLSLMNTRSFHWVLWELAKWWWFLKVWASLALFDGIIETILMAFSRNIFQAYAGMFVFENNIFTFW